jgi:alanine racemase
VQVAGTDHTDENAGAEEHLPPFLRKVSDRLPPATTGVLHIDLAAIQRNYARLAGLAGPAECAAVIKADAYGLGIHRVAPALAAAGCKTFFVATLDEARRFNDVAWSGQQAGGAAAAPGWSPHLYVLNGLLLGSAAAFAEIEARPVLGSMDEIIEWAGFGVTSEDGLPAALHVDTGMNRLGVKPSDYDALIVAGDILETFPTALVMSHLACGDTPEHPKNAAQLAAFMRIADQLPDFRRSLANSAGVFLGQPYAFDLVRPGIALYGGNPFAGHPNPMEPVVRLYGRIAQLGDAERGETVGYGAARTLTRRTRYAAVTAGYADGYFRNLGSVDGLEGATAYIGDHALPILGRVSMDLIVFDITDLPAGLARRGGFVELIGDRYTVDDAAASSGTIPYEVLTSLGRRYQRIYTGLEKVEEASSEK